MRHAPSAAVSCAAGKERRLNEAGSVADPSEPVWLTAADGNVNSSAGLKAKRRVAKRPPDRVTPAIPFPNRCGVLPLRHFPFDAGARRVL
jgi:hypothetical protein